VTTAHERNGALEAVERIVNRGGDDVVVEVLGVLRRIYASAYLADDGTIAAAGSTNEDRPFLERVATLISAHVPSGENAQRFRR
jgi:hypothetical protein